MTAELIRKTPFADWKDPDAWMEAMKGPKWEAVLQEEATNANKLFLHPAVQRRIGVFRGFLDTAKALHGAATKPFDVGPFEIVVQMDMFKQWRWKGISTIHDAHDCLPHRDAMLCTKDIADGAEQFELQVWLNKSQIKPTWTLRNVGPEIGALDTTLFYLNTRKRLQYYQLWRCDWKTGANKELLFEVPSDQVNLTLERQSDGRLFLLAENAQDLTVFELTPSGSLPNPGFFLYYPTASISCGQNEDSSLQRQWDKRHFGNAGQVSSHKNSSAFLQVQFSLIPGPYGKVVCLVLFGFQNPTRELHSIHLQQTVHLLFKPLLFQHLYPQSDLKVAVKTAQPYLAVSQK
jgi:hypothetical protein